MRIASQLVEDLRVEDDRRNARPFGTRGPWLDRGKMGGLIFTDRRRNERRAEDKQLSSSQPEDIYSNQNEA